MVMAGRIKLSFHSRVLLIVLVLCSMLVAVFLTFQYAREKKFRIELFNAELQMNNAQIEADMNDGYTIEDAIKRIKQPIDEVRVTLIDRNGVVVFDSNDNTPFPTANHNDRVEIRGARANGEAYVVERFSESDGVDYFYSAMLLNDGYVIRTAAPYTHSLRDFLRADRTFLWFILVVSIVISLLAFFATRKISLSIKRLNAFAEKAERGEKIFNDQAFPHDELGSIAGHIVRLYVSREAKHNEVLKQEQDKIRLKKQLTNNINHELKTPLASILLCLELLREFPELPDVKRGVFMQRLYDNAQRLNSLLKDVSTITRMDEGAEKIEREQLNLADIVAEIIADARLRTTMKIVTDVAPCMIYGNRFLVEAIFRNLIENAIAYSGGSEIRITADAAGNITFSDNGCGIPAEHLPHIFERFYRVDKGRSRAAGGTGLGLSIVRNAIAIHGGSIFVSNRSGLHFSFRLS